MSIDEKLKFAREYLTSPHDLGRLLAYTAHNGVRMTQQPGLELVAVLAGQVLDAARSTYDERARGEVFVSQLAKEADGLEFALSVLSGYVSETLHGNSWAELASGPFANQAVLQLVVEALQEGEGELWEARRATGQPGPAWNTPASTNGNDPHFWPWADEVANNLLDMADAAGLET
jgi:hypothetical protein